MRAALKALVLAAVATALWPPSASAQRPGDCGFYIYGRASEGRHCAGTSGSPPPQRVTAICRDRTYSYEQGSWTCWDHGGVQTRLR
ncbi:MAG: hypothetical protein ACM3JG_03905 [Thiohalocapsa sp.]